MTKLSVHSYIFKDGRSAESRMRLKKQYKKREAIGWVVSLAAAVAIALALRFFVFEFVRVDGPSMQPILYRDEYVFMERVSYWFRSPKRGDIIVCSFPGSEDSYIKRVVGLPGEKIKVEDGVLYIDGAPNYDYFTGTHNHDTGEFTVPENSVAVMGDNRNDSTDSRAVGPIAYDKIMGKADFIIWPLDKVNGL